MVILETQWGDITLVLHENEVPNTCRNFLHYVEQGAYNKTIFHRVIDGFMIQGGGFDAEMQQQHATEDPIENEADKGRSNKRGTIAMARTPDPHSASAQFFINVRDNDFLDFRSKDEEGWGYCVFGEVVEGMDIVDKISKVQTTTRMGHQDVPEEPILILKAKVVSDE